MNKLLVRGLFAAALAFGTVSLTACPAPYTLPTTAGAELTEDFWKSYYPEFKQDMSWTYAVTSTASGSEGTAEALWKVTEVKDGVATVKMTVKMGETTISDETDTLSKKGPGKAASGVKYEKTETVTVAAGEFKDAVKGKATMDGSETTMWVAKGVGIIKLESTGSKMELKAKSF
ncbi:hypothetical protein J7643_02390 [bacterium]|nr:hypothetical protein [bacterium]